MSSEQRQAVHVTTWFLVCVGVLTGSGAVFCAALGDWNAAWTLAPCAVISGIAAALGSALGEQT